MPRTRKLIIAATIAGFVLLLATLFVLYFHYYRPPSQAVAGSATLHLTFSGHTEHVWSVAFSPKEDVIASASVDGTARLWRVSDGSVIQNLKHPSGVTGLSFSRDGQHIATSSYDAQVRIWSSASGKLLKSFSGHTGTVWFVEFSPDGKMLASSGEDKTIKLWDINQGTLIKSLEGHSLNVWAVSFSPDGKKLASSSFDNSIKIWDVDKGRMERTLNGHTQAVLQVDFSPDGKMVASCGDDSSIRLWNLSDGNLLRTMTGDLEHVYACKFSPDGKQVLSGSRDRSTFGELLQTILGETKTNKGVTVRLWNVADGSVTQSFAEAADDVHSVAFSPDGKWIAAGGADKRVYVWRAIVSPVRAVAQKDNRIIGRSETFRTSEGKPNNILQICFHCGLPSAVCRLLSAVCCLLSAVFPFLARLPR